MDIQKIKAAVVKFVKDEEGLTAVEYAIAGGLISAGLVAIFTDIGTRAVELLQSLLTAMNGEPAA